MTTNSGTDFSPNFDYASEFEASLDSMRSIDDFCERWRGGWRQSAIAFQSVLRVFYPTGAKLLGILIAVADKFCEDN